MTTTPAGNTILRSESVDYAPGREYVVTQPGEYAPDGPTMDFLLDVGWTEEDVDALIAQRIADAAAAAAQLAAEGASIPSSALVTSVGSPGSDSNVPSEKAVRSAITTATGAAESAAEAACDAAGAAATVQGNLNTHAGLTTTAHGGLVPSSALGADSGVATLDAGGHLTATQIPSSLLGAVVYQGTWDCSGAAYPATPATGQYWVCSVAGTISGTSYAIGDILIYNGSAWERLDSSISLANLSGGAETVGGSASNGTATTAARSDHVHAINSISAATEDAAGLMAAADKTKLDGIASGATALSVADLGSTAETVGGSAANGSASSAARSDHKHAITAPKVSDLRWIALTAGTDFTATPASTSTLTMLTDQTGNIPVGAPIKFVVGGNTYYAQVTALTSALMTVRGTTLGASALTSVAYDSQRNVQEFTLNVETAWTSTGASLAAGEGHYMTCDMPKAHLIGWKGTLGTADTGAAQPYVEPYLNGSLVTTSTQMSATPGTWVDGGVWSVDVSLTYGQAMDAQCPTLGSNKTAARLNLQLVFVLE